MPIYGASFNGDIQNASKRHPWPTSAVQRLAFVLVLCIAAGLGKTEWEFLSPVGFVLATAILLRGSGVRLRAARRR